VKHLINKKLVIHKEWCAELHSHMDNISEMDQSKFQKLVGKIEVLGELLIKNSL
jgi:hypothetical protein